MSRWLACLLLGRSLGFVTQAGRTRKLGQRATDDVTLPIDEVKQCLAREYRSFFDPLEAKFYAETVSFKDPLNSLSGLAAYRANVDMLAGRSPLGRLLFNDAAIVLHSVEQTGPTSLRTRWSLRVTFSILPWRPVARFTGISEYRLEDGTNRILGQEDYWDSIDLCPGGRYSRSSRADGFRDFVGQVLNTKGALDGELPYELLRRAEAYSIRRYPACAYALVNYESRPEGYDILGSYAGGSNKADANLRPFLPSIITVPRDGKTYKTMRWPISMNTDELLPDALTTAVSLRYESEPLVIATLVFTEAATEAAAKYYTNKLEQLLDNDGLVRAEGADNVYQIAQYDAIFSVGDRRNEVWIPLEVPDYWRV